MGSFPETLSDPKKQYVEKVSIDSVQPPIESKGA